jgi:hypothetical protein
MKRPAEIGGVPKKMTFSQRIRRQAKEVDFAPKKMTLLQRI